MQPYQIISDSSCDIPLALLKELNVGFVPYYASFDTINYYKEFIELTADDFYDHINTGNVFPKTSLPPIPDYMDVFEPYLKEGKDILCICLSSKFSGSFQSATIAKSMLAETFPERRIEIVDSIGATGSQGLLVYEATRMRDKGFTMEQLISTLEKQKITSKINFTVDSLDHLQKGGRIGKATAFAGNILNIKPIIVLKDGELFPEKKIRGHSKALSMIFDMIVEEIGDKKDEYQMVVIRADRHRIADAAKVSQNLVDAGFHVFEGLWSVGITIGTHAGPTAIGICYIKKFEYL